MKPGRPPVTGRFASRFELENAVRWAFFHTKATTSEIATRMRVSQSIVRKITEKGPPMPIESGQPVGPAETFTQPKITGYRQLNQVEADLMNMIKTKGVEIDTMLSIVGTYCREQSRAALDASDSDELARLDRAQAARWLAIAKTDFQTALMALTRAVAQPSSF